MSYDLRPRPEIDVGLRATGSRLLRPSFYLDFGAFQAYILRINCQPQQPAAPAAAFNSEWSLPGKAPTPSRGLENEGNYCYMNSVLVALMHCAVFVNWLASHARNCQSLTCIACGIKSLASVYWQEDTDQGIPLDVASSIAKILRSDRVFGTDRLEGVACASANCSHQSDRDQLRSFTGPPKILAVEFRRFEYDYQTRVMHKNPAPIDFPSTLDLSPFAENNERVLYHLKSVVHHQGSLRAGHYIAYGLGPRRSWSRMNDHRVRRSNFNEASTNNGSNGFTPYMLFY
ncbi:MAG: hypothetical protein Q9195_006858 [Heterodermia aff. obscurata]